MRIGIDIDDTIANTEEYIFSVAKDYIESVLKRKFEYYPEEKSYHKMYNCSRKDIYSFMRHFSKKQLLSNVTPFSNAKKIINMLKEEGHEIYFITSRNRTLAWDIFNLTENWLKKYNFNYDKLIVGIRKKGKTCKKNKIDLFIDDNPNQCLDVSMYNIPVLMYDAINNKNNNEFKRVYDWNEIYKIVEELTR